MGCNSSKQEDIRVDRERRRQNARKPGNQPNNLSINQTNNQNSNDLQEPLRSSADINSSSFTPTTSQSIHQQTNQTTNQSTGQTNNQSEDVYGTSYTNRRAKEFDLLNQIIKQTRDNFIDVSAINQSINQSIDDEDRNERSTLYAKSINQSTKPSNNQSNSTSSNSQSNQSSKHSMYQPLQSYSIVTLQSMVDIIQSASQPIDQSLILDACKQMSDSIINVSITPSEPIVYTFEELIARQPKRPMTNQSSSSQPSSHNSSQTIRTVQIA